jgi:RND family efflux transporter MFP subunit
MNKVRIILFAVIVLGGIVGILLFNRSRNAAEIGTPILKDVPVTVATVTKQQVLEVLSLVGTITANNDVNVVSETQGRVTAVRAKVGDFVNAGTILVQVDDELKQAALTAAEVNYEKAKRDYERYQTLLKKNTITVAQLDASRLAFKSAESQYTVARRQFTDTRITTPISGYVTARPVDIGTMVQPGMAVANVVDITKLKARLNVAERDVFKLKEGDGVEVTTEVYPGVRFDGKIQSIASKGDEAHTYPVEVILQNSKQHPLKAGMFGRVAFNSVNVEKSLTIPREALVGSIKEPKVFVVDGTRARLRSIVVGGISGETLSVTAGLREGEQVVVNGQNNLQDSTSVSIIAEGTAR